jgi:hypothetical protein
MDVPKKPLPNRVLFLGVRVNPSFTLQPEKRTLLPNGQS